MGDFKPLRFRIGDLCMLKNKISLKNKICNWEIDALFEHFPARSSKFNLVKKYPTIVQTSSRQEVVNINKWQNEDCADLLSLFIWVDTGVFPIIS